MNEYRVGIAGATGAVGQRFVQLLSGSSMFVVAAVGASDKSVGKRFSDAAHWILDTPIPESVQSLIVGPCTADHFSQCEIVFSALESSVAGSVEIELARAGVTVFSNAKNYRMTSDVPILLPLVNASHLQLLERQRALRGWSTGGIVTNANCSATGLATVLKPLHERFVLESVHVVTMQAISGGGYPGVPSLDILGNVIPFIDEEEKKLETETLKILGQIVGDSVEPASFGIVAACNRVPVLDGHTECVTLTLRDKTATCGAVRSTWLAWRPDVPRLSHAPTRVIDVLDGARPQPRLDVLRGDGFTVSVGRLRANTLGGFSFVILSHNTILGAAGGSILNAELAIARNLVTPRR